MVDPINEILSKDSRYKSEAYGFVLASLEVARVQTGKTKHVTGFDLLQGLKTLAIKDYGIMAKTVLESWGIKTTDDIGEIVFNLIDTELLSKTSEDQKEDFHNIFDFDTVFMKEYPFIENTNQNDSQ